MSLPTPQSTRPSRRSGRAAAAAAATLALVALPLGSASAHVTVQPESTAAGSYSVLTFRVPTESDTAGTTGLAVTLPTGTPFTSVRTEPIAGWEAEVVRGALPAPVDVQGTTVTEAPLQVVWTAQDGAQVPPGQFQRFTVQVGPLPAEEGTAVVLPAVQSYSDGEQVAWDQTTPEDGEEPEHPAPVLVTTAAAGQDHGSAEAEEEPAPTASGTDDTTARLLGGGGLALGAGALVLSLVRGRRSS